LRKINIWGLLDVSQTNTAKSRIAYLILAEDTHGLWFLKWGYADTIKGNSIPVETTFLSIDAATLDNLRTLLNSSK
jgi:hypothetical protein